MQVINYFNSPSLVGNGFFSSVTVGFNLVESKFSIPAINCCCPFSASIAEKKNKIKTCTCRLQNLTL